jgi:hypothetical protein
VKKGDSGFHTYRREDGLRLYTNGQHKEPAPAKQVDWNVGAQRFAKQMTAERREQLAELLGLPVADLASFPLLGYFEEDSAGPCFIFPEHAADSTVIGLNRRFVADGSKKVMQGGKRGLTIPNGWRERPGPILIPEGASDTVALTACGLAAVGRPSNSGGADLLARLLKDEPAEREIVILGENDLKENGDWPGGEGKKVAEKLSAALNRPVQFRVPPREYKDGRAWVQQLAKEAGGDWALVGREVLARLGDKETEFQKPTRWPRPVKITELPEDGSSVEWLWHGCFARRHITLFSALMKSGKTTLSSHLLRALQHGDPFVGRATRQCRTLVVSEESHAIWRERRDTLCLDDHLSVLCRPMIAKPTFADWTDFLTHVEECATADAVDLVVIDTVSAFAPWKSENDSAEVMGTLTPLNRLTKAGFAVVLFHHFGKADGTEGRGARGSTALAGAADILLELRRFRPEDLTDRRRVLSGLGRFDEIPEEVVIELKADGTGYTAEGDRKAVAMRDIQALIEEVLPPREPGLSAEEVHKALPSDTRPRRGDVMKALVAGAEQRRWRTAGTGKKLSPRLFWMPRE